MAFDPSSRPTSGEGDLSGNLNDLLQAIGRLHVLYRGCTARLTTGDGKSLKSHVKRGRGKPCGQNVVSCRAHTAGVGGDETTGFSMDGEQHRSSGTVKEWFWATVGSFMPLNGKASP